MISEDYILARRNTVKESSSFYSMVSSTMRRFYLRTCEKTMLSLHLSQQVECKCRSMAQSVGFLYRVVETLQSACMRIFMSRKDILQVECSNVNMAVGWRLFMKSFMNWSCLVVPRNIRETSSMNLFQKRIAQTDHDFIDLLQNFATFIHPYFVWLEFSLSENFLKSISSCNTFLVFQRNNSYMFNIKFQ